MPLHIFVPGESALVAENLDANFQFLLNLIQGAGSQSLALATGSSTASASGRINFSGIGTAIGTSTASASNLSGVLSNITGTATGIATSNVVGSINVAATATAAGTSQAQAFTSTPSVGTATGTSATNFVGARNITQSVTATGTSTANAVSAQTITRTVTATGLSTANATGAGSAVESNDNTFLTQPNQTIFASNTPGQASSNLSSFTLSANPGVVVVNGVNDATTSNVMELYYNLHVLYRQNSDGSWFQWTGPGAWSPTTDPTVATVFESVEGTSVIAANVTMWSSNTPGSAAPSGASVANGQLQTWGLTGNPGQVIHGVNTDTTTANVVQLYYHNHSVFHRNSSNLWWQWDGSAWQPPGGSATSPIPTSPTINIATIPAQVNTNTTFVPSGTYQAYPGPGTVPTLQYADNATQAAQSTTWSPTDKSASITLTNANMLASSTAGSTQASVRSTTSFNTGKMMFEVTGTSTPNWVIGIANSAFNVNSGLGDDNNGIMIQPQISRGIAINGGYVVQGTGSDSGTVTVTCCADFGAKTIWFSTAGMRTAGFPWNNSATANPGTGTGGISFAAGNGPYFICFNEFDTGGTGTLNTLGPFAVAIPSGFATWDTTGGGATTWLSLPSNVNVKAATWSFVHPPIAAQNPSFTVSVRDASNTGVVGKSNTFAIATPGVVTLNPMTLDNLTFTGGSPSGTVVGHLSIPTTGGTFTGNVTSSDSRFTVVGSGSPRNVQTTAVLGTGSFPNVIFTAVMVGAVNSPESLTVAITGVAESSQGTDITTIGPTIVGSANPGVSGGSLTWALVAAGKISLNGVTQTFPASGAVELYYIDHRLYMATGSIANPAWSVFTVPPGLTGGAVTASSFVSCSTPKPNIVLNKTTFTPTNGNTGITASLMSNNAGLPNVTWTEDSASFSFTGNQIFTVGSIPDGFSQIVNITATIPS